ncbi:MAG: ATP-binding protein [Terracidiphilus sp.]|jgi:anti-sigma regulatory factor (Ser/Thr protein kinase)
MPATNPSWPQPRLTLQSQLEDLTLVWPWVQALADRYSISAQTLFAIELCLEEALSNIVRYGYRGQENQSITVDYTLGAGELVFTIQDHAPHFDPFAHFATGQAPPPTTIDELRPGGQGIRLMRKFASRLDYQPLPNGNRLTLAFTIRGS